MLTGCYIKLEYLTRRVTGTTDMNIRQFLTIAILIFCSQSVFSHDRECLDSLRSEYNRPCIERLIPRSLDIDNTMLEPQASLFSEDTEGAFTARDQLLVAVLGASGRTGIHVPEELKSRGANIRALSIGATGGDSSELISYEGSINFVEAAKESGVKHIIYMSSIGAGGADNFSTVLLNLVLDKTMKWKSLGEDYIRNSGIDFTIVRPGGLRGEPGTLGIRFEQGDEVIGWIPRADVASVLVESIYNADALNKTFEVINDESLDVNVWRDEFKNLKNDEYGEIATGELPARYWLTASMILLAIIYLIRRRRKRRD